MPVNPISSQHLVPKGNSLRNEEESDIAVLQTKDKSSHEKTGHVISSNPTRITFNASKSPRSIAPNSAKKRRHVADLSRFMASPSHSTKMSMMFRDASTTLEGFKTPATRPSSNIKKSRLPFPQATANRLASGGQEEADVLHEPETPTKPHGNRNLLFRPNLGPQEANSNQDDCVRSRSPQPTSSLNADPKPYDPLQEQPRLPSPCISPPTFNGVIIGSSPIKDAKEPISSGFATPSAQHSKAAVTPDEVRYPEFGPLHLPHSSPNLSRFETDSDGSTNDGVPVTLNDLSPTAAAEHAAHIETWLEDVLVQGSSEDHETGIPQYSNDTANTNPAHGATSSPTTRLYPPARHAQKRQVATPSPKKSKPAREKTSSDKENISPTKPSFSPIHPPIQYLSGTPSRFQKANIQAPLTPSGYLSVPPKRKRARTGLEAAPPRLPSRRVQGENFTIHEDQLVTALANLSPDVDRHRKGRGPKRERCASYWDEDILSTASPAGAVNEIPSSPMDCDVGRILRRKGKKVLGESKMSAESSKEKGFAKEADGKGFEFHA